MYKKFKSSLIIVIHGKNKYKTILNIINIIEIKKILVKYYHY